MTERPVFLDREEYAGRIGGAMGANEASRVIPLLKVR